MGFGAHGGSPFSRPTMRLGFRCAHDDDSSYRLTEKYHRGYLFGQVPHSCMVLHYKGAAWMLIHPSLGLEEADPSASAALP
jgi:hypothetical protein